MTNKLQLHDERIEKHHEILQQMNISINKYVGEMIVSSNCGLPNYIFWEKYSVRRARIRRGIVHTKRNFPLRISSVNVTFTEGILNGKLFFLCSEDWEEVLLFRSSLQVEKENWDRLQFLNSSINIYSFLGK